MDKFVLSVFELNTYVSDKLYRDPFLKEIWVRGEISDLSVRHGIAYFVLSDETASVDCMLFDFEESGYAGMLEEGQGVVLNGDISIYRKNGRFRVAVKEIEFAGLGELYARLEKLRKKLDEMGVFALERKRPVPQYPQRIGIVTSGEGAALQDIINVVKRRSPFVKLALYPVKVQGAEAPGEICAGIRALNGQTGADVLIVGRGGGSAEDLFAFNDENVVMAIFQSRIPVISAVGHESDWTLADMAADLRAPTPSAAAELAVPVRDEVMQSVRDTLAAMRSRVWNIFERERMLLETHKRAISADALLVKKENAARQIAGYAQQMKLDVSLLYQNTLLRYHDCRVELDAADPLRAFERGYSILLKDGRAVKSVAGLKKGDNVAVQFADGSAMAEIKRVNRS